MSNGGLHALGWIIICLIMVGISMLVHYEESSQRERALVRHGLSSLEAEFIEATVEFKAEHRRTQELILEARELRMAIGNCGRIATGEEMR